jgi:hypothetical protein
MKPKVEVIKSKNRQVGLHQALRLRIKEHDAIRAHHVK